MNQRISRRNLLKALGIAALSGAGGLAAFPNAAQADPIRARDAAARIADGGSKGVRGLGKLTPMEGVNWVNMTGPRANALDASELSRLEMNHRRQIWHQVERLRGEPGYENVYLMETAPQLGVRMSRLLAGVKQLTYNDAEAGTTYPDVIGYSGDWINRDFEWQIPYGALVPRTVDNILAAGRCISGERKMADLLRVIPPCFVTGHAAGAAAAVCVQDGCLVRDVEVAKVRNILKEQDAYLG